MPFSYERIMMKKFERFCVWFLMAILGIMAAYLTYMSLVTTAYMYDWEDTLFINDNIILNIFAVVLVIAIAFRAHHKKLVISERTVKIYIVVVNALMVWFVLSTQFAPVDDQFQVLSTASAFLSGNHEPWNQGGYCFRWGHQNGIVLIYAFLSWIFGEGNSVLFQLLNILFVGITYYCIGKSFQKLFSSSNTGRLIQMALYTFLPYLMYITYIYGTLIGMMFATVGIYLILCYLENHKIRFGIAGVLSLAVATVCKSNFFIHVIAVCILLIVEMVRDGRTGFKESGRWKATLLAGLILACLSARITTTAIIEHEIQKEAPQGSPTILFVVMGMQEGWRAPGWCNSFDDLMYEQCEYDQKETKRVGFEWFKKETAEFLYNPDYAVEFFNQKMASIWANPTFECFEIQKSRPAGTGVPKILVSVMDVGNPVNSVLMEIMDVLQTVLYFGVVLFVILSVRKIHFRELIYALVFVGAFVFYILWEARCHYTVPVVILLIPYAVLGYAECAAGLEGCLKNRKEQGKWNVFGIISPLMGAFVVLMTVLTAFMADYSIPQEKETYEQFLSHYAYGSRIADGSYRFSCYLDDGKALGLKKEEDGTALCIEPVCDTDNQYFKTSYHFLENGLNRYYIFGSSEERMLYLRDEAQMGYGKVYLHNYSMENKNLWSITEAGDDACYIKNIYGMALAYNIYTNDVLLIPFTGEDNQKWKLIEK